MDDNHWDTDEIAQLLADADRDRLHDLGLDDE